MSEMKMSDHFDLPVSFDVDLCKIYSPSHNLIEAKAISLDAQCYAINNHDRMVEEIAELKAALELMILQFESDHNCEYEYKVIKSSKNLLTKLNQEGEG